MLCLSVGPSIRPYPTIFIPSNAHAHHIIAWVTQPERPKDEVKPARKGHQLGNRAWRAPKLLVNE